MPDDTAGPDENRPYPEEPGRTEEATGSGVTTQSSSLIRSERLPIFLLAGAAVVAVGAIAVAASCAPTPPVGPAAATGTPTATTTGSPAPAANGPVITAFQLIDDVSCTGAQASVPVSWATRDAQSVQFEVDGGPVGAGYALSGIGTVPVPCDGKTHRVALLASGEGKRVAVSRQVNTASSPPPAAAPAIAGFDLLDDVTCSGATVDVPAAWRTQNAQAVNFSVDGQPLSAAAGFPVTGVGNVAVPCDGNAHTVTLTATGTGPAASLSRSVNTTVSSGPTTTVTTTTITVTPTTTTVTPTTTG